MESVVDGVEDEGETAGSPANPQCNENSGGFEVMRMSFSVNHWDGLPICGLYQGHQRQTGRINANIFLEMFDAELTSSGE